MSDLNSFINSNVYSALIETLIQLMQNQILQLVKLHGVDKLWVNRFIGTCNKMANYELKHIQEVNFSESCKELWQYLNRDISTQQSIRSRGTSMGNSSSKKRSASIYKHISMNSVVAGPSNMLSVRKKTPANIYYSKIMNTFLNPKHSSVQVSKKRQRKVADDKDFWVLGDEIKLID